MYKRLKSSRPRLLSRQSLEAQTLDAFSPPFTATSGPSASPLILASPHSGAIYPKTWLSACKASLTQLRATEDVYIDTLWEGAAENGAAMIAANFPRSFVDLNRAARELPVEWADPSAKSSLRAKAGLGVIPTRIGDQMEIYSKLPTPVQGRARLDALYYPYHRKLGDMIARAKSTCGEAVLIDCHSMPGFGPMKTRRADFILGDRFGRACAPELTDLIDETLTGFGYTVTRNHPYAGGFTTAHYGDPHRGIHALQIEINRDLYVRPLSLRKKPGYAPLKAHLTQLADIVMDHYGSAGLAQAAE